MIRILIVDDQSLFREALRTLLSVQNDFEVVAEACNGEEALRLAVQYRPDVVLMDLRMPIMDGVTATRRLHSVLGSCRVIVLTTYDGDEDVLDALRSGAVGYLLKDVTSEKLYEAIRLAARGEYVLHPTITAKVVSHIASQVLTSLGQTLELLVFLFKQKTAYEITYGDWSSDVCSSDLSFCGCSLTCINMSNNTNISYPFNW